MGSVPDRSKANRSLFAGEGSRRQSVKSTSVGAVKGGATKRGVHACAPFSLDFVCDHRCNVAAALFFLSLSQCDSD